jgi:hypothetical protein
MQRCVVLTAAAAACAFVGPETQAQAEGWLAWLPWTSSCATMPTKPGQLYLWGGPGFGRVPRQVPGLPEVVRAVTANNLCAAITVHGSVYVIQPNGATAASGVNALAVDTTATKAAPLVTTLLDTGMGRAVDVAVLQEGLDVVVVGVNGSVGIASPASDGRGYGPARVLAGALKRARIAKVRCGTKHCVAVSTDGDAYSFGDNSYKQLGIGEGAAPMEESVEPVRMAVPKGLRIMDADCGDKHTVLVTEGDGAVLSCGDDAWTQGMRTAMPWVKKCGTPIADVLAAECVEGIPVSNVSCGAQHTALLARDGTMWTSGVNLEGQLGHHNITSLAPASPIANISIRGVAVAAGRGHSCILTKEGEMMCLGGGEAGQLGSGPRQRTSVWRHVKILTRNSGIVTSIAAGGDTSAAIVSIVMSTSKKEAP